LFRPSNEKADMVIRIISQCDENAPPIAPAWPPPMRSAQQRTGAPLCSEGAILGKRTGDAPRIHPRIG